MKLYLIRQVMAEAESESSQMESALSEKAKTRLLRVSLGLAKMGVAPELILSSPLTSAHESAQIIARGLGGTHVEKLEELAPASSLDALMESLRSFASLSGLGLVGHQPQLGRLASLLLSGSPSGCELNLKKFSATFLRGSLVEDSVHFVLQWLIPARALRRL